jgi:hypothetical protein
MASGLISTPTTESADCCIKTSQNTDMNQVPPSLGAPPEPPAQPRNPLHGVTLELMVSQLAEFYGWAGLGERIPVRCFTFEPSVKSSLKFLRKTPWAREKVEGLYLFMLREIRRNGSR